MGKQSEDGMSCESNPRPKSDAGINSEKFALSDLKPRGKWLTSFNIISAAIILIGVVLLVIRFTKGLGSITNLSQDFPWGLWIGFDVTTGVAFAGGAYVLAFLVYVLRLKKYHSVVRVTILNGFLAYLFYAGALLIDLGRPWNIFNPFIGNSFGVSSVLFLVAWHFLLYMVAQLVEFSPAIAEWLGQRRLRKLLTGMTLGAAVFGITLSTLHQSGLGALFLMAKGKIHPLWYSEFIPLLYFVSSIYAGLSMVIFEGTVCHKVFRSQIDPEDHKSYPGIVFGLSRICAGVLLVYMFLQILVFIHENRWAHMGNPMGYWYLTELIGFVLAPWIFFLRGLNQKSLTFIRIAAGMSMIGIVLNRLNITIIAFKSYASVPYVPSWMEIEITLAIICAEIWLFRYIVNRMPVLRKPPQWALDQDADDDKNHPSQTVRKTELWKPQAT